MTRSNRKVGVCGYDSDEFATAEERKESRKAFRKSVRAVFGQTGKATVVDLDVPARAKRRWNKGTFTENQMVNSLDLAENFNNVEMFDQAFLESKENLKQKYRTELFEEFCVAKPPKVVKKVLKKLEREGKETTFDDMSTDSETEKELQKWCQNNNTTELNQTRKYMESESPNSFKRYRRKKQK